MSISTEHMVTFRKLIENDIYFKNLKQIDFQNQLEAILLECSLTKELEATAFQNELRNQDETRKQELINIFAAEKVAEEEKLRVQMQEASKIPAAQQPLLDYLLLEKLKTEHQISNGYTALSNLRKLKAANSALANVHNQHTAQAVTNVLQNTAFIGTNGAPFTVSPETIAEISNIILGPKPDKIVKIIYDSHGEQDAPPPENLSKGTDVITELKMIVALTTADKAENNNHSPSGSQILAFINKNKTNMNKLTNPLIINNGVINTDYTNSVSTYKEEKRITSELNFNLNKLKTIEDKITELKQAPSSSFKLTR